MSDNQRGAVYMMIAMLVFMLNDALMKSLAGELSMFQALSLRSLFSALILLPVVLRARVRLWGYPRRDGWRLGFRCLAETASSCFYISALFLIPLADATAILQVLPLTVTLAAALFLGEPVGWRRLTAILVGFGGVMLILRPGAEGFQPGALLALAGVVMVTIREILTRSLSREVPSLGVTFYTVCSSVVLASLGMLVMGLPWELPSPGALLRLGASSLLMVIGFYVSVLAVRTGALAAVTPFRYTSLVFALVIGFVAFGELPGPLTALGALIVAATGLFTLWRERRVSAEGAGQRQR